MKKNNIIICTLLLLLGIAFWSFKGTDEVYQPIGKDAKLIAEGKETFRHNTFGGEGFWTGILHLDKAVLGSENGGYGGGVSPSTALAVGLKVDSEMLPAGVVQGIEAGTISLKDPKTSVALLKLNAVVGLKGTFSKAGDMTGLAITCALCHSTVDNSYAPGIGKRLDGWANRDLNVGAIISLTDNADFIGKFLHVPPATATAVLQGWGPGKFNAGLFVDGKALKPDGTIAGNLIPSAYGMKGVGLTTYTGWGDITYWNSFVANLEMHGQGTFTDTRLDNATQFPIASENNFGHVKNNKDLITSKLAGLKAYQLSLNAPTPPKGSFDAIAAANGKLLFQGKAQCAACHAGPAFTDSNKKLHSAEEIGIDNFEASRSPTGKYRTTPLRGLFARSKGGYYHDGRFATLNEVVVHYDKHFKLSLTPKEKSDLAEYLKSI